jgi:hypothetical protein
MRQEPPRSLPVASHACTCACRHGGVGSNEGQPNAWLSANSFLRTSTP